MGPWTLAARLDPLDMSLTAECCPANVLAKEGSGGELEMTSVMSENQGTGMNPGLEMRIGPEPGAVSIRASGVLDSRTVRQFKDAFVQLVHDGHTGIRAYVSDLNVRDVEGMRALVFVQRVARLSGSQLRWDGLLEDYGKEW